MRQALALALQDFSGAMIIVSHDRHLLRVTCDRLLLVHNKNVDEFPLSLDDYPQWLREHNRQQQDKQTSTPTGINTTENSSTQIELTKRTDEDNSASARKEKKRLQAENRKKLQPLRKKIAHAEKQLDKLKQQQIELEKCLSDTDIYSEKNKHQLQQTLQQKADIDSQYEKAENRLADL